MEVKEITNKSRHIHPEAERMLWARSAGICEFRGCCRKLYTHHVTGENINLSEKAHIYAFSQRGKRFSRLIPRSKINDPDNLMMVCKSCHSLIDSSNTNYSAEDLLEMKAEHEQRIERLVSIKPDLHSEVVIYNANIGNRAIRIADFYAMEAITPEHYPARNTPINLSPDLHLYDCEEGYWSILEQDLIRRMNVYESEIRDKHISLFAIAPQPLLFRLGMLLNRNYCIDVRQSQGSTEKWRWPETDKTIMLEQKTLDAAYSTDSVAVTVELTAKLSDEELRGIFGNCEVYRIVASQCSPGCIKSPADLTAVSKLFRSILNDIRTNIGSDVTVHFLPIAPASVSIELGRQLMKGDPEIWIYDRNYITKKWNIALKLNGQEDNVCILKTN